MPVVVFYERFMLGQSLKWFVKSHPEIEDITGYSQGYYSKLINDCIRRGMPIDATEQTNLFGLIREAF